MATDVPPSTASLPADRFYRTALWFLVLTGVMTLVSTGKLDLLTSLVAPVLVLYKGVRWWKSYPPELPQSAATRLVLAYLFLFPVDLLLVSRNLAADTGNPALFAALLASVHFLLFVTVIRLYSVSSDRDALFLAMLTFACVLASAVFTVDTSFLAFFLVFLVFAVAVFVGLEVRRGATGTVSPVVNADRKKERRFNRALSLAALAVALGATIIGTVLFFLFPRVSAGYFAHATSQTTLMSGFTDDVELGQIGELKKDSSIVMRVQTGAPIKYPLLRWRGIALSHFDGRRWYSKEPSKKEAPKPVFQPAPDGWITLTTRSELEGRAATQIMFVTLLEPIAADAIFAPSRLIMVRGNFTGDSPSYMASARRSYLEMDSTQSVFNPFKNFSQIRYEGISILPTARPEGARDAGTDYPAEIRDTYLTLPEHLDPRIPEFARRITANAKSAYEQSLGMESYLRSNFTYSLNLTQNSGKDPLAQFLFNTKAGHCEYFASSMAVMLRTLGIPSREVNGFLPGEYNEVAGDYIVRASDAHSWVEAYFPGYGWLTFDPTPPSNDAATGVLSRLALYVDWFQLTWNEWVINYDFARQATLARNVGQFSADWKDAWRHRIERAQDGLMRRLTLWQAQHPVWRFVLPVLLIAALLLLRMEWFRRAVGWFVFRLKLGGSPNERNNPQMASRLYVELLRVLEKQGFRRTEGQTPREFATSFVLQPALAPAVTEFTDLYAQARFGGLPCDAFRLRALLEQIRSSPRPGRA
jgi:transglutaminase-like putative cysteine protease